MPFDHERIELRPERLCADLARERDEKIAEKLGSFDTDRVPVEWKAQLVLGDAHNDRERVVWTQGHLQVLILDDLRNLAFDELFRLTGFFLGIFQENDQQEYENHRQRGHEVGEGRGKAFSRPTSAARHELRASLFEGVLD